MDSKFQKARPSCFGSEYEDGHKGVGKHANKQSTVCIEINVVVFCFFSLNNEEQVTSPGLSVNIQSQGHHYRGSLKAIHPVESRGPLNAIHPDHQQEIKFYNKEDPYYEFTNFYPSPVVIDGQTWPTTEHYFQSQKFVGTPYVEAIRRLPTPKEAFQMSRTPQVSRWCRGDWEQVKENVMLKALRCKFGGNPKLMEKLVGTRDKRLVEHTSNDSYWGDGGDGRGKNKLGELLEKVRTELRTRPCEKEKPTASLRRSSSFNRDLSSSHFEIDDKRTETSSLRRSGSFSLGHSKPQRDSVHACESTTIGDKREETSPLGRSCTELRASCGHSPRADVHVPRDGIEGVKVCSSHRDGLLLSSLTTFDSTGQLYTVDKQPLIHKSALRSSNSFSSTKPEQYNSCLTHVKDMGCWATTHSADDSLLQSYSSQSHHSSTSRNIELPTSLFSSSLCMTDHFGTKESQLSTMLKVSSSNDIDACKTSSSYAMSKSKLMESKHMETFPVDGATSQKSGIKRSNSLTHTSRPKPRGATSSRGNAPLTPHLIGKNFAHVKDHATKGTKPFAAAPNQTVLSNSQRTEGSHQGWNIITWRPAPHFEIPQRVLEKKRQ